MKNNSEINNSPEDSRSFLNHSGSSPPNSKTNPIALSVRSFRRIWNRLKKSLTIQDMFLFYSVVDIERTGRRSFDNNRKYDPRFMDHWFAGGRCHWNVILPCYLLNGRNIQGKYQIITNEKHSAIINVETGELFDPTYEVLGCLDDTLPNIGDDFAIVDLIRFTGFLEEQHGLQSRFIKFLEILGFDLSHYHACQCPFSTHGEYGDAQESVAQFNCDKKESASD